jgi:beta-xylosidase
MMGNIIFTDVTHIGDPFVLLEGDTYYLYATSSEKGFNVWKSNDLLKWESLGLCYENSKFGISNFWAPEVIKKDGKFYILFTSRDKELNSLRLSVAISDKPYGPFIDIKDRPIFDFGYAIIDGTFFKDDDGKYYLYFVKDCCDNIINGEHISQIFVAGLKDDLISLETEPVLVSTPSGYKELKNGKDWHWNEGPFVTKHNGKYYLSYSFNGYFDKEYSVAYSIANSPFGPFEKQGAILEYIEGITSGPGHNMYFYDKSGQLKTAFHIHSDILVPDGNRRVCFANAYYANDRLVIDYK